MKGTVKLKSEKQQTTDSFNCFVLFCSARFLVRVSFSFFFFFLLSLFSFCVALFRVFCCVCFPLLVSPVCFLLRLFSFRLTYSFRMFPSGWLTHSGCFLPADLLIPDVSFRLTYSFRMFPSACFVLHAFFCVFLSICFLGCVLFSMFCSACVVPDILFQSGQLPPPSPPAVPRERCQPTPLSAARAPPAMWDSRKVVWSGSRSLMVAGSVWVVTAARPYRWRHKPWRWVTITSSSAVTWTGWRISQDKASEPALDVSD